MPSFNIEIFALGSYTTSSPILEIWADGALYNSYFIIDTGTSIVETIPYSGSLPSNLEFRFNDGFAEVGRTIDIRSVKINDKHVNVGNYLDDDNLNKGDTATVDVPSADFIFDDSESTAADFLPATKTYTAGNDTARLYSSTSDEAFDMLGGHDFAHLGSGDDSINGGAGNDTIRGGEGNDLLYGAADNDRLFGNDGNDTIYGGTGDDRIYGHDGDDELHGGDGNDKINGHNGDNLLTGGIGNDILTSGTGVDYLFGGDGNDQLVAGAGADTLDGGDGDDIVIAGAGDDIVDGGDNNDTLVGDTGDDVLLGGDGVDTIFGDNRMVIIGQAGTITTNQTGSTQWHTVTFDATIIDPAVVLTLNTENDSAYTTLRVQNVTNTGFEWQIDEWDYLDGVHGSETISWMAVASGRHTMDDGTVIEAGVDSVTGLTDTTVNLSSAMPSSPIVMAQVTTTNEASALTTHIDNRTASSFTVHVEEEKANQGPQTTNAEDFAWIAIDEGGSAANGFLVGNTGDINSHTYDTISFGGTFMSNSPVLLASIQNEDGGDPSTARTNNLTATDFDIKVEEENSSGDGVGHTNETQGYFALTAGILYGDTLDGDDIINGGRGLDTLYGGDGADTFLFEATSAYADVDKIMDFRYAQGDVLDISDLISGAFGGTITDYVQFTDSGSDTLVQVDSNGLTGGSSFSTIASLEGITGLDETSLYTNGNIVV